MPDTFTLTGTLRLLPSWVDTLTATTVTDATTISQAFLLTDGEAAGQANFYWRDVRTIAAGDYDDINLEALPFKAFGGQTNVYVQALRMIYIRNRSTTAELRYGLESGTIGIEPSGTFFWSAPYSLAPPVFSWISPRSSIFINNLGESAADYEIVLVGVKP